MKTHKRSAHRLCALLCTFAMLFCGCGEQGDSSYGNDKTQPLDHIVNALSSGSAAEYETAFPPDFCKQYHDAFASVSDTVTLLLETAHAANRDRCGENYRIRYELTEQEETDFSSWKNPFRFDQLDTFGYSLPLERIERAVTLHVTVYCEGSYQKEQDELVLTVLQIDRTWYLHPKHFGTVLRNTTQQENTVSHENGSRYFVFVRQTRKYAYEPFFSSSRRFSSSMNAPMSLN